MRWTVVILLVFNLAVFGWYRYAVDVSEASGQLEEVAPEGASLQLLDTPTEGQVGAGASPVSERAKTVGIANESSPPASAELCDMIGAFREQVSARQVRDRLESLGVVVDLVEIPVTLRTDYWVHLGPYSSRDEAMVQLRALQQKGVDSFLIADGVLANGISLGLFRQRGSAEALLAQRKSQGHDARLKEIPRVASELWVVIKEGAALADEVRGQLLAVSPGTEYRKNPCSVIVSADKFE